MEGRTFKYSIYKNNVWKDLIYKGVVMNSIVVYTGINRKDCERWVEEHVKKNR